MTDLPISGGSYIREKDGTLRRQSDAPPAMPPLSPAEAEDTAPVAPSTRKGGK